MPKITKQIIKSIHLPKPNSNKYQNGRLLIVAGSQKYHGALLFALKAASRLVGIIYILSSPDNYPLIKKLKGQTAEFITIKKLDEGGKIDCILVGSGLEVNSQTKSLVAKILKIKQKTVLDAGALRVLDQGLMKLLHRNVILTPHHGEFRDVFSLPPTPHNAAEVAKKYRCFMLLKGSKALVATPEGKIFYNTTGNAGMAKGGSGDVLAGLISGLFSKNDALTAAAAGLYVNGRAGDDLYKTSASFYNSEDLSLQVPKTLKNLLLKSE